MKSHPSLKDHQALVTNLSLWNLSLSELKYLDKCGLASGIRLMVVSISFCQFPSDNFILCPTIKFLTNCKLRCPPSRLVALKPWAKTKRWKNQTLTLGSKVYNPLEIRNITPFLRLQRDKVFDYLPIRGHSGRGGHIMKNTKLTNKQKWMALSDYWYNLNCQNFNT